MKKNIEVCLNCSHENDLTNAVTYIDSMGHYAVCEKCKSSFDIEEELL